MFYSCYRLIPVGIYTICMVVYFMLISINADDIDHSTTLLLYTYYYHVFIFVKINVNIGISHI